MAQPDGFGYDILQIDEATRRNKRIASDHLFVWNRLIENAGPNKTKMDELNPERALQTLMTDQSFKNFLGKKTLQEKITVLRDVGMHRSAQMNDEELAKYLMTHVPDALTEDPAVGRDAKQMAKNQDSRSFGDYAKQAALTGLGAAAGLAVGGPTGLAVGGAAGAMLGSGKKELDKPIWKREDKSLF